MIGRLKNRISSFFKSASKNKKLSTYAFFIFISFSFWFLSMLSKHHETSLKVPVTYSNFPADKLLSFPVIDFVEVIIINSEVIANFIKVGPSNFKSH